MALLKEIELLNGSTASYWRVEEAMDNRKDGNLLVAVSGYKSAQHRLDGKPTVVSESYVFSGENYPKDDLNASGAISVSYTKLKELSKFSNATDV